MGQLDLNTPNFEQLIQEDWQDKLVEQTRTGDVYSDLAGTFVEGSRTVPDAIVMNLPLRPGIYKHTIGLMLDLTGPGVNGPTDQEGNEVDQDLKWFIAYSNDYSQAVNTEQYGISAHQKKAYGIIEWVTRQLGTWHKQKAGLKMRQALVQVVDDDLTVAPTSRTQRFNSNIFIKGIDIESEQPVYDSTVVDYGNNIGDALELAGVTDWDVTFLNNILEFARRTSIQPYMGSRYVVTIPSFQATPLLDPSVAGSFAGLQRDTFVKEIAREAWDNSYLSTYGGVIDIFTDESSPMITAAGSTGSWTLSVTYDQMGTDDDRPTTGTRYDAGGLLGKSALVWAEHESTHTEEDPQNYGKRKGVGAFRGAGANLLEFDVGTETDTSRRNQNSALLLAKRVARNA